jgi:RHS repeat-associated protein
MVTDQNGNVVARHDYLPFGEEVGANWAGRNGQWGAQNDTIAQKFTGQERDGETGVDYFQARYYHSGMGRFTSPDPANAGADILNPQSWNGYAYALNNPLANVDPSGMDVCDPLGDGDGGGWDCWPPFPPPCLFFDCGGGGGGGGTGAGGGGKTSSPPLPPNSFPGGETLGLPPGMSVPLPSPAVLLGLRLNLDCEFGVCVGGLGNGLVQNPTTVAAESLLQKIFRPSTKWASALARTASLESEYSWGQVGDPI